MAAKLSAALPSSASLPCAVVGVRLIRRLGELPPFQITTGVFVDTATTASLCEFFSARLKDPTATLLLDAPGMGKTTTVERAAEKGGAVYIRFSAKGIMSSALHETRERLKAAAANGSGVVEGAIAEGIGIEVWKLALVACMNRCREGLARKRRMLGLCDENGVDFSVPVADIPKTFDAARAALLSAVRAGACSSSDWLENAAIALHFDEIQLVLPEQHALVGERYPPAPATPSACMQYSLVWFSSALHEMCLGGCMRPCMTGISVDAVYSLRLDSSIKLWPLDPLPYFSARFVKQVLATYVSFEDADDLEAVVSSVVGCPRAVQYALLVIRRRAEAIVRGEPQSQISCYELVALAYDSWRACGASVFLGGQAKHLPAAEEAFLCTCYPSQWGAQASSADEGVPVAVMPTAGVKRSWRDAAYVGVIRLRMTGDIATIFPPYPFLERYIRSLGPQRLAMSNCIELVQRARLFPSASGAMGRGKAFEYAVALEFCLPGNALLKAIIRCAQLRSLKLQPQSNDVLPLRNFNSTDLGVVCSEVRIVTDGDATVKPGDVAVPVSVPVSSPAWLIVEVKSSTAADASYVRQGQVSFVEKMRSKPMQRFHLSCYLPTLDTRSQRSVPGKADSALASYNLPAVAVLSQRYMGLVVLDDALLAACTLGLASVLQCEEHLERTEAEWYRIIFSDAPTRALIAAELHARASSIGGAYGSSGVDASIVGSAGGHDVSSGAARTDDETSRLRRENEKLRQELAQVLAEKSSRKAPRASASAGTRRLASSPREIDLVTSTSQNLHSRHGMPLLPPSDVMARAPPSDEASVTTFAVSDAQFSNVGQIIGKRYRIVSESCAAPTELQPFAWDAKRTRAAFAAVARRAPLLLPQPLQYPVVTTSTEFLPAKSRLDAMLRKRNGRRPSTAPSNRLVSRPRAHTSTLSAVDPDEDAAISTLAHPQ